MTLQHREIEGVALAVDRVGQGQTMSSGGPLGRGRKSIELDLKSPDGLDVLLRLTQSADVLVEGFRPGVAERLGFGPQECLARHPRLVYARLTGWGQDGPLAPTAGDSAPEMVASSADPQSPQDDVIFSDSSTTVGTSDALLP